MSRSILLDTDIGSDVDDALALGLILAHPRALDLVAVTTLGGDAHLAARIAASLLALGGRADVEVAAGASGPLLRAHGFNAFGHEEKCIVPGAAAPIVDEGAAERIVRASHEVRDLELVLVGPMTNAANALALDPGLPSRVAGITVMGGHVRAAHIGDFECPWGIDYNLCIDPEASMAVLGAGFRTTLITADVTLATWLRSADVEQLAASGPLARALALQVGLWAPLQRAIFTGMGGPLADDNVSFLHDPLTVLALIDEAELVMEDLTIVPTIQGGVFRTIESPDARLGSPMRVATAVNAGAASRRIANALATL